jgi:hypothetical protein
MRSGVRLLNTGQNIRVKTREIKSHSTSMEHHSIDHDPEPRTRARPPRNTIIKTGGRTTGLTSTQESARVSVSRAPVAERAVNIVANRVRANPYASIVTDEA